MLDLIRHEDWLGGVGQQLVLSEAFGWTEDTTRGINWEGVPRKSLGIPKAEWTGLGRKVIGKCRPTGYGFYFSLFVFLTFLLSPFRNISNFNAKVLDKDKPHLFSDPKFAALLLIGELTFPSFLRTFLCTH